MSSTRRLIIRRVHRETGIALKKLLRDVRGWSAGEIARWYLPIHE